MTDGKGTKYVELAGEAGSADKEASKQFFKTSAKSFTGKGLCGRADFFNTDETDLFHKNVGRQTSTGPMAFWLTKKMFCLKVSGNLTLDFL